MKYIASALLLAGQVSSTYPIVDALPALDSDGFDTCSQCIMKGGIYAGITKFVEPFYRHITDAPYANEDVNEVVLSNGNSPVYCSDNVNDLDNDFQISGGDEQWQSSDFEDMYIAIMACPYVENRCGDQQVWHFHEQTTQQMTLSQIESGWSCTYKIETHNGAPGFNVNSEIDPETTATGGYLGVVWVEYDLEHLVTDERFKEWPGFETTTKNVACESNCAQGFMPPRLAIDEDGHAETTDSGDILMEMQAQRLIYEKYQCEADIANTYNAAIVEDPSGESSIEYLDLPVLPDVYSGNHFHNTGSLGGYGSVTSGDYDVEVGTSSGYKSYGAMGQGTLDNLSVNLDTSDQTRVMLISVIPFGDSQAWYQDEETVVVELGSYPWRSDIDFSTPMVPSTADSDGANMLAATIVAGSLVALNLF